MKSRSFRIKDLKDLPQLDDKTRLRNRPSPAPQAPPILGQLKVTRCPDVTQVGRVWPLRGETTMLGRDPDNLVALNDPDVSRHHARSGRADDVGCFRIAIGRLG